MVARLAEATQVPIDGGPVTVGQGGPSLVTYYTAAIGVMFMLFSALSTTGWLLEDQERGVLDRMRASGIGPWSVLLNRFVFAVMGSSSAWSSRQASKPGLVHEAPWNSLRFGRQ